MNSLQTESMGASAGAAAPDAAAAAHGAEGIVAAQEGADFLAGAARGRWAQHHQEQAEKACDLVAQEPPGPSSSPLTAQTPPSRLRPRPKEPATAPLGFGAKVEPKTPTLRAPRARKWGGDHNRRRAGARAGRGGTGGGGGAGAGARRHSAAPGAGAPTPAAAAASAAASAPACPRRGATFCSPRRSASSTPPPSRRTRWRRRRRTRVEGEARAECLDHLDASLGVNGDCDVLHRYRSRAYNHLGKYDSAKRDADKAVALNPRSAPNLLVQGQCLQQVKKNSEIRRGSPRRHKARRPRHARQHARPRLRRPPRHDRPRARLLHRRPAADHPRARRRRPPRRRQHAPVGAAVVRQHLCAQAIGEHCGAERRRRARRARARGGRPRPVVVRRAVEGARRQRRRDLRVHARDARVARRVAPRHQRLLRRLPAVARRPPRAGGGARRHRRRPAPRE